MAFLDYEGLSLYDKKIKEYIDNSSTNVKALTEIEWEADDDSTIPVGTIVRVIKDANGTVLPGGYRNVYSIGDTIDVRNVTLTDPYTSFKLALIDRIQDFFDTRSVTGPVELIANTFIETMKADNESQGVYLDSSLLCSCVLNVDVASDKSDVWIYYNNLYWSNPSATSYDSPRQVVEATNHQPALYPCAVSYYAGSATFMHFNPVTGVIKSHSFSPSEIRTTGSYSINVGCTVTDITPTTTTAIAYVGNIGLELIPGKIIPGLEYGFRVNSNKLLGLSFYGRVLPSETLLIKRRLVSNSSAAEPAYEIVEWLKNDRTIGEVETVDLIREGSSYILGNNCFPIGFICTVTEDIIPTTDEEKKFFGIDTIKVGTQLRKVHDFIDLLDDETVWIIENNNSDSKEQLISKEEYDALPEDKLTNNVNYFIYDYSESSEGGSTVSYTQIVTEGTKIGEITINEETIDIIAPNGGGSTVSYEQVVTEGTTIGTITINGQSIDVIAPQSELPEDIKLNHSITIGDNVFDGSADVVIPIYDGM